jgi:hypothetical protein
MGGSKHKHKKCSKQQQSNTRISRARFTYCTVAFSPRKNKQRHGVHLHILASSQSESVEASSLYNAINNCQTHCNMSAEFMDVDTDGTGFDDDTLGMGDDTLGDDDMIGAGDFEEDGLPDASDVTVGTGSDTSAADIVEVADQPAIPPYFGGAEGHALRESAADAWVAESSAYYQLLSSIMTTEMYQTAASYCQTYVDEYNEAAATVLYLEHLTPPSVTYEEFWGLGASVLDGAYDLAS